LAKPEWGSKRTCSSCGARFYDLRRDPITCPICTTVYDPERQPRVRRGGPAIRDEPVLAPEVEEAETVGEAIDEELVEDEAEDVDLEDLDDSVATGAGENLDELASEDGELIEDTSELGEDVDDIGEVMEHVDDELEDKA
jgi:uncharacterized protein (TIGR02300 family)